MLKYIWPWSRIAQLEAEVFETRRVLARTKGVNAGLNRDNAALDARVGTHWATILTLNEKLAEQERLLSIAFFHNAKTNRLMKQGVRP